MLKAYLIFFVFGANFLGFWFFNSTALADAAKIEEISKIFLVRPDLRHEEEKIEIRGNRLEIRAWYDRPPNPNPDQMECLTYRWLLGGRGQRLGEGAPGIFQKFPEIQTVYLELFELDPKTRSVDGRGQLEKTFEKTVYAKALVRRSQLQAQNRTAEDWKAVLWEGLSSCLEAGRSLSIQKELK
ncbi:MAG: hypothetical protein EA369_04100 [Bradymonadales bacterium]|nr:MAG: hypothetical protein EA369_04100 [Bradymonadales bacterium]